MLGNFSATPTQDIHTHLKKKNYGGGQKEAQKSVCICIEFWKISVYHTSKLEVRPMSEAGLIKVAPGGPPEALREGPGSSPVWARSQGTASGALKCEPARTGGLAAPLFRMHFVTPSSAVAKLKT